MDIYTKEIYNFLQTVTIKGSFLADQYANLYKNQYKLSSLEDIDNPYYLHMCGQYSKFDVTTDKIYVESIDSVNTGQSIPIDVTSHILYPRTIHSYKLPNDKFNLLLEKYPNKKHLIESILYPVTDLSMAINADDFTVLNYDSSLLEENERDSLIQRLFETVCIFKNQFYIKEFFYEDGYPLVLWGTMWLTIYKNLFDQRIKNIRTPAVHTSHIWNYLTSKGVSDYRTILNRKQQYWLYKNFDYLIRNRGKNNNIQLLAENILESYLVDLKQKSVLLNYKNGLDDAKPIIEIISEDLYSSSTPTVNTADTFESLKTVLMIEYNNDLRKKNDDDTFNFTDNKFSFNSSTYHPTRIVEIDKKKLWMDYYSFYIKFIIDNYLYRLSLGDLNYKINITLVGTSINKTLYIGEALALLNYCFFIQQSLVNSAVNNLVTSHTTLTESEQSMFTPGWFPNKGTTPLCIPSVVSIDMAFKKEHDYTNTQMTFNDVVYSYIEKNLPERVTIPDLDYNSPEEFMIFLESQFNILVRTSLKQRSSADKFLYRAIDAIYKPCLLNGQLAVNWVDGFTEYSTWFDANPDIKSLITILLNYEPVDLETFMVKLSDSLFPSEFRYSFVKTSGLFNDKYYKLKQLFTYLCSYSIGFVDTQIDDEINLLTIANVIDIEHPLESNMNFISKIDTSIDSNINIEITMKSDLNEYSDCESEVNFIFVHETTVTVEMEDSYSSIHFVQWNDIVETTTIIEVESFIDLTNNTTTITDVELG